MVAPYLSLMAHQTPRAAANSKKSSSSLRATLATALGCAVIFVACAKDAPVPKTPPGKSAAESSTVVSALPQAAAPARWESADGAAIYLPSEGGVVQVVLPPVLDDSVPVAAGVTLPQGAAPASVDLFATFGKVGSAQVGDYSPASQPEPVEGCDAWPVVTLRDVTGAGLWRIALLAGVAEAVPTDSLGSLSRGDSAQLVVQINKAAALLPLDSAGMLRRVPFAVTKAYRMQFPGEVEAVVAVVERRLNMEASPKVERTVLVLERTPGVKSFSAVWRETQYATEDELVAVDMLAVVRFHGGPRVSVFLGMDFGDGSRIELLRRTSGGIWSVQWASAYTGC